MVPSKGTSTAIVLPASWDEHFVSQQIEHYQRQPALLTHFIHCVKDRFIVGQEDRTAAVRSRFIKTKIEQLKLAKELQLAIDDLNFLELEREIRRLELENRRDGLQEDGASQRHLAGLHRERDALKIKLEIAQINDQMQQLQGKPEAKVSKDQQRLERRQEIERDIERLKTDKVLAAGRAASEQERRRVENMYDDRIQQLQADLARYL